MLCSGRILWATDGWWSALDFQCSLTVIAIDHPEATMQNVIEYIDAAREQQHLKSDRALARSLGITATALFRIRAGHGLPSDKTMMRLAALAGVSAEQALMDLNAWRSKGTDAEAIYQRIGRAVSLFAKASVLAMVVAVAPPRSLEAVELNGNIVTAGFSELYIMRFPPMQSRQSLQTPVAPHRRPLFSGRSTVRNLEQHVAVTRRSRRAPARQNLAPQLPARRLDELGMGREICAKGGDGGAAVGNLGIADAKRIPPPGRPRHRDRALGQPPSFGPSELNASRRRHGPLWQVLSPVPCPLSLARL